MFLFTKKSKLFLQKSDCTLQTLKVFEIYKTILNKNKKLSNLS